MAAHVCHRMEIRSTSGHVSVCVCGASSSSALGVDDCNAIRPPTDLCVTGGMSAAFNKLETGETTWIGMGLIDLIIIQFLDKLTRTNLYDGTGCLFNCAQ